MVYTVPVSSLWNKWNILCTVVKLIWDAIVEDYQGMFPVLVACSVRIIIADHCLFIFTEILFYL